MKIPKKWSFEKAELPYVTEMTDFDQGWSGLKRFGYDIVANLQPKQIVELGVFKGTSFFSFAQAVVDKKLATKLYGVDTWEGDIHTGFYTVSVLDQVQAIIKKYFKKLPIQLHQVTFDQAVEKFSDGSIDLLHIDGLHTYDAVAHDFEQWHKKVSPKGIILFHDTNYKGRGFGVYKFWDKIKKKYHTVELLHSNGLGILVKDETLYKALKTFEREWQQYYPSLASEDRIKESERHINYLKQERKYLEDKLHSLQDNIQEFEDSKFFPVWRLYCNLKEKFTTKKTE